MISSSFVILESDAESEVEESEIPKNLDQPPSSKNWLCWTIGLCCRESISPCSLMKYDIIRSQFFSNASSASSAILNTCAEITEMEKTFSKRYEAQEHLLLQESNIKLSPSPVHHDLGKCSAQFTENEKCYLIKAGPQQPKLALFPRKENISSTK